MKRQLQSYFSFTRVERLGAIVLSAILLVLITVRATMHLWVKPEDNRAKEKALATAWVAFKNKQSTAPAESPAVIDTQVTAVKAYHTYPEPATHAHLFPFNPNTLDSAGFIRLGLRAKTTAILLHWRAKGKVFRRKEELKKVYTLTPEDYQRLEPYILLP